jgi:hypothetical protein
MLSERSGVYVIVDAEDYDWLSAWRWNIGWHAKTKWKYVRQAKCRRGASHGLHAQGNPDARDRMHLRIRGGASRPSSQRPEP